MRTERPARLAALDDVMDRLSSSDELSAELFGLVDAIDDMPRVKRALTDPNMPDDERKGLAHALFDSRLSEPAVTLVVEAAGMRWTGGRHLIDAIEREAVRCELQVADQGDGLDSVEDELFRFGRLVDGNPELRAAVTDQRASLERRSGLFDDLLGGKVGLSTIVLAKRAVKARHRSFGATLESYVELAAQMRDRSIATVRVARPLTDEQRTRLSAVLRQQVGRQVALQEIIDPEVLGGVRVEMGGTVIEGTVAGRLDEARRQLN